MLIGLGIILLVLWLVAKFVWNVASFGIHFLLLAAVVAMVFHFVKGGGLGKRAD